MPHQSVCSSLSNYKNVTTTLTNKHTINFLQKIEGPSALARVSYLFPKLDISVYFPASWEATTCKFGPHQN